MPVRTTEKAEKIQKDRYLRAFRRVGTLSAGCKAARCSPNTVYKWREFDDEFVMLENQAREQCADALEEAVVKRATRDSDVLAIFMLKAMRPEKYRERHDITSGGQPIQPAYDLDLVIEQRLAAMAARGQSAPALAPPGTTITVDATG